MEFIGWLAFGFLSYVFYIFYISKLERRKHRRQTAQVRAQMDARMDTFILHVKQGYLFKQNKRLETFGELLYMFYFYFFAVKWLNPVGRMDTYFMVLSGGYIAIMDTAQIWLALIDLIKHALDKF